MLRPQNRLRRLSGFETNLRPIIELQVAQSRAESLFLFVSEDIRVDQAKWCRKRAADEARFGKHSRKTGGKRCRNSYTAIHSGEDTLVLSGQQPGFWCHAKIQVRGERCCARSPLYSAIVTRNRSAQSYSYSNSSS